MVTAFFNFHEDGRLVDDGTGTPENLYFYPGWIKREDVDSYCRGMYSPKECAVIPLDELDALKATHEGIGAGAMMGAAMSEVIAYFQTRKGHSFNTGDIVNIERRLEDITLPDTTGDDALVAAKVLNDLHRAVRDMAGGKAKVSTADILIYISEAKPPVEGEKS
jgi:hypothetical protein